jgi:hypothetical protein
MATNVREDRFIAFSFELGKLPTNLPAAGSVTRYLLSDGHRLAKLGTAS